MKVLFQFSSLALPLFSPWFIFSHLFIVALAFLIFHMKGFPHMTGELGCQFTFGCQRIKSWLEALCTWVELTEWWASLSSDEVGPKHFTGWPLYIGRVSIISMGRSFLLGLSTFSKEELASLLSEYTPGAKERFPSLALQNMDFHLISFLSSPLVSLSQEPCLLSISRELRSCFLPGHRRDSHLAVGHRERSRTFANFQQILWGFLFHPFPSSL